MENHPYHHDWYRQIDIVTMKNSRGRVIEVRREEDCRFCPTKKITKIDTNIWEKLGHPRYKYVKDHRIDRVTPQEFLRRFFFNTTDLPHNLFEA